jgi:hypothetical protein
VWPGVKVGKSGEAEAGPTGPPWVDSNGWRCLLAQARNPGKPVWVFANPEPGHALRPEHYQLAVADAAAHGGQWVVSVDSKDAAIPETWKAIGTALQFFKQHDSWRQYPTLAHLGVISSFAGDDEFLSHEVLNLAPRRYLSCRIIEKHRLNASALEGLRGAIWVDEKPPTGDALQTLQSFAAAGGTVILPFSAAQNAAPGASPKPHKTGYTLYPRGKGIIAIPPDAWSDPYVIVADAQLVLSRKHDVYRLFNSGAMNVRTQALPGGGVVAHILNYTARSGYRPVSIYLARPYKTAKWGNIATGATEDVRVVPAGEGVEVHLPAFASYAAVEFGGLA